MPIDTSMYGQIRTPEPPNTLAQLANVLNIKNALAQNNRNAVLSQMDQVQLQEHQQNVQANKMKLDDAERDRRDDDLMLSLLPEINGDYNKLPMLMAKRGASMRGVSRAHQQAFEIRKALAAIAPGELAIATDKGNRLGRIIADAISQPDDVYVANYGNYASDAKQIYPDLQISDQPMPKEDLRRFALKFESQQQALAREAERRAAAEEGRKIEEFEATLPGKKADSQLKVATAAGNAPIQPADRARLAMDQKQFELAQKKYLLDVRKASEDKELSKILTPVEAATLGVPYGTTRAQAAGKMPSTAAQQTVAGYASRIANSNKSFDRLWQETGGLEATWNKLTPTMVNTSLGQEFDQIQRDFINATLRRESGAVISDSEFANARAQYLPQIGDSKEVLERKAENRAIVQQSFIRAAGNAYQDPESLLREAGMGQSGTPAAPAPSAAAAAPERPPTPKMGTIRKGYMFIGGDPADKNRWKKVRQ